MGPHVGTQHRANVWKKSDEAVVVPHLEAEHAEGVVGADVVALALAGGGPHEGIHLQVWLDAHRLFLLSQLLDLACRRL